MGGRALPDPKKSFATSLEEKYPAEFFKRRKGACGENEF